MRIRLSLCRIWNGGIETADLFDALRPLSVCVCLVVHSSTSIVSTLYALVYSACRTLRSVQSRSPDSPDKQIKHLGSGVPATICTSSSPLINRCSEHYTTLYSDSRAGRVSRALVGRPHASSCVCCCTPMCVRIVELSSPSILHVRDCDVSV